MRAPSFPAPASISGSSKLQRNFGQAAALQAGIDVARGRLLATLDGDLQNDPRDIPTMIARLEENRLDLLCGWRKERQDGLMLRLDTFLGRQRADPQGHRGQGA